jgi:hypothetical protein
MDDSLPLELIYGSSSKASKINIFGVNNVRNNNIT